MLQNKTEAPPDPNKAALMELSPSAPPTLKFSNSNKIIRTGGSRKEIEENYEPDKHFFAAHLIAEFFKGGYKTELVNFIEQPNGNYRIQSNTHKDFYLNFLPNKKTNNLMIRYERDCHCEFTLHKKSSMKDFAVIIKANRCEEDLMNDSTFYEIPQTGEEIFKAREYYWMIDYYIWEIAQGKGDNVNLKLIADNLEALYLTVGKDGSLKLGKPDEWHISEGILRHVKTGKRLEVKDNALRLGTTGTKLL